MSKRKSLPDGFVTVDEYLEGSRGKVFLNVRARGKCGKTSLLLTAPPPVAYFCIDASGRGPMDKLTAKQRRDVAVNIVRYNPRNQDSCMRSWENFLDDYDASMEDDEFRSVVIDTQDELLVMQRLAVFGDRRPTQYEYATPNAEFLGLFKGYHSFDKTLVVATRMDKEYKESKTKARGSGRTVTTSNWTGGYIPKGKTEMEEYLPECNVQLYRFKDDENTTRFGLQIDMVRVGIGPEADGYVMETPDDKITIPNLLAHIFPDTDTKDWT